MQISTWTILVSPISTRKGRFTGGLTRKSRKKDMNERESDFFRKIFPIVENIVLREQSIIICKLLQVEHFLLVTFCLSGDSVL